MAEDKINPNHYKGSGGLQAIDVVEIFDLNFSRGNAIKYILRAGRKSEEGYDELSKEMEDLTKAVWYINREIERVKGVRDGLKKGARYTSPNK